MNNPGPSCSSKNTNIESTNKMYPPRDDTRERNESTDTENEVHNRTSEDVKITLNTKINRLNNIFENIVRNIKIINIHNRTHENVLALDEDFLLIYDQFLDHSNNLNNTINCLYDDYPLYKKYMKIIILKLYIFNINSFELSKGFNNSRKFKNYTVIKNLHLSKSNINLLKIINHVNNIKEKSYLLGDNKFILQEDSETIFEEEDIISKRIVKNKQNIEEITEKMNNSIQDIDEQNITRTPNIKNDTITQNINDEQNRTEFNDSSSIINSETKYGIINNTLNTNNLLDNEKINLIGITSIMNDEECRTKHVQHEVRTKRNELTDNAGTELIANSNEQEPECSDKYNKRKTNELLEISSNKKIKSTLNNDFSNFKSLLNQINSDILQLMETVNEINLYLHPIQNSLKYSVEDEVAERNLRRKLIKEKTIKKWQMQQIRRSIFDNVSNTLLEEQNNLRNHEYLLFNAAVLSAISNHGLHNILPDEETEENDSNGSSREENDNLIDRIVCCENDNVSALDGTSHLGDGHVHPTNEMDVTQLETIRHADNGETLQHLSNDEDDFLTQAVAVAILNKGLST